MKQLTLEGKCAHMNVEPCCHMHIGGGCFTCQDCGKSSIYTIPKNAKIHDRNELYNVFG